MTAVTGDRHLLAEAAPELLAPLAPADRARARRLALQTLRWADRSDRALGPFLRHKPWPRTHGALRLALAEIFVEGAAPHGAVDAAVALVRATPDTAPQAGMVNAVLRNVLRQPEGTWDALPLPRLPKWLRKPLSAASGKDAVAAIESVQATPPPLDLTARGDPAALAAATGGMLLPTGSVRLPAGAQVTALPGFDDGAFWVQDAAAALPALALAARPGERALDLCAAPGGKTLQLAAAGADVTALDVSAGRMARVTENLQRCGLRARTVVADALDWTPDAPFDAILLDAPCSATGTIRRHPDLPHAKDAAGIAPLLALQARLALRAAGWLKPGGRMVYCTCSLLPEEGEAQLAALLSQAEDLSPDPPAFDLPGIAPAWRGADGMLRTRPDLMADDGGIDGFYAAALRRAP